MTCTIFKGLTDRYILKLPFIEEVQSCPKGSSSVSFFLLDQLGHITYIPQIISLLFNDIHLTTPYSSRTNLPVCGEETGELLLSSSASVVTLCCI